MSPIRAGNPRFVASVALEGGLILGVLYGLTKLTLALQPRLAPGVTEARFALPGLLFVFATCLYGIRRARLGDETDLRREFTLVCVISVLLGGVSFFVFWALFGTPRTLSAFLVLEAAFVVPAVVTLWRWVAARYRVPGISRERVLIVGTGESADRACRWILDHHWIDYQVIGFAGENQQRIGDRMASNIPVRTDYSSLVEYCSRRVDRVLVALDEKRGKLPIHQLMQLRLAGVQIEDSTPFLERISGKLPVVGMLPSSLIFSDGFRSSALRSAGKQLVDSVISVILLVVFAPIMAIVAALIVLEDGGPIFYRQQRLGLHGQRFHLLKFRSMVHDAEKRIGPTWAGVNDSRVTRVGRVIRKLRLDELPQIWNVLRGEMSLVGPRPEREHFVGQLEQRIPYYALRLCVRPGITGWAQVRYGYGANEEDALEKLKYDLYYIKNGSPLFDLWIILKTVKVVLLGSGAR